MDFDKETGEIKILPEPFIRDGENIELCLEELRHAQDKIKYYKTIEAEAKRKLLELANFADGNTARLQGTQLKCKIERPTKILWDQKKLAEIACTREVPYILKISTYRVDMREYKKLINTVGNEEFNKFKEDLMSANCGVVGSLKFTIE